MSEVRAHYRTYDKYQDGTEDAGGDADVDDGEAGGQREPQTET